MPNISMENFSTFFGNTLENVEKICLDSNVHVKFSISLKVMLHVDYSCKIYMGMLLNGIVHYCQVPLPVGKY
jgi:hypothetical protein